MKQIANMNNAEKNLLYLSLALSTCLILFNACKVSIPKGAKAVKPFDSKRYLGKWYEIAHLDFKYEKNLDNVTATYTEKKVDNPLIINPLLPNFKQ